MPSPRRGRETSTAAAAAAAARTPDTPAAASEPLAAPPRRRGEALPIGAQQQDPAAVGLDARLQHVRSLGGGAAAPPSHAASSSSSSSPPPPPPPGTSSASQAPPPGPPGKPETKPVVLDRAVHYINHLVATYEQYESQQDLLRRKLQLWLDDAAALERVSPVQL
ncbi:hypothetical protein PG999_012321 [Apiospora kogelbergensis]|uniref:BHLH domain-containing protein n=1 Tax=Apiospora kogelbergensis TaxID=1337665 RepID=A0AAW0QH98_9PEZI